MTEEKTNKRTVIEEIEVSGSHLVEEVKALIRKGNVRQLRIQARDGDVAVEVPLTIGAVAGGAVTLAAPWLAVLGVIAALVARVRIEIESEEESAAPEQPAEGEPGGA